MTYISRLKNISILNWENAADVLAGARDIIAEWVSEDATARQEIRKLFWSQGTFSSKVVSGRDSEAANWQEPVASAPSHRVLAMLRGEKEALLSFHIAPPVVDGADRPKDATPQYLNHFALPVATEAEFDEAYKSLQDHGVRVTEIIEREYGKTFYFHDPNGIRLQIELQTSGWNDDLTGDPDPVPMVRELSE